MKGILARTAIALSPLLVIAALAAPAGAAVTPDVFTGTGYIAHYSDYLTDYEGAPGSGNPVTFHNYGANPTEDALWDVTNIGTVSSTWPFGGNSNLCGSSGGPYCGHAVVEIKLPSDLQFSAGTTDDLHVVLRPQSDGNYWVENSLGGPNYQLINVHASNDDGGGVCLTDDGSDTQAALQLCPDNSTMTWKPLN
jgi:hypothetical protein